LPPDERVLAAQRERGVQRALAELPPEQALVVRLSFFEEHPHAQIAQELGIPLGTVKSRIRLAVAQLRRILDTFGP
jgi:RNA polymerase sigma-70 factor (ECF subfamily)